MTKIDSDLGLPPELAHIQIAYTNNLSSQWMLHQATGDTPPEVGRRKAFEELPLWDRMAAREAVAAERNAAAEAKAAVTVAADVLAGPEQGDQTAEKGASVGPTTREPRVAARHAGPAKPVQSVLAH